MDQYKKLVCYRCGKPNHTNQECTSKAYIYNCKELTTNPNHTAATCFKPEASGINKVGYRYRGHGSYNRARGGHNVPMPGRVLEVVEDHLVDLVDINMNVVQIC